MKTSSLFLRVAAATAAMTAATHADAATFVLNNVGGAEVGTQARKGFEIAVAYWASVLKNNVTINLNIGFAPLAAGVIGSTGSATALQFNADYYNALANNITSSLDTTAVANLSPLVEGEYGLTAVVAKGNALNANGTGYLDTATRIDNDGSQNNSVVSVNTAVNKALGMTTDANGSTINYANPDGAVTFSSNFAFDFDPTDGIDADKMDFIGVAIHEIGHALGFRSGVDVVDAYTAPGNGTATLSRNGALENVTVETSLDLFRYSTPGMLDWSTQGVPYFSIDGGQSQLFGDSRFATGVRNGDGRQASHYKDSPSGVPQIGIMDPTSGYGQMQQVTALDVAAFDAIGWQTSFNALNNPNYRVSTADIYHIFASVPEPTTWIQMIAGFGMMGGALRVRRRAAVKFAV